MQAVSELKYYMQGAYAIPGRFMDVVLSKDLSKNNQNALMHRKQQDVGQLQNILEQEIIYNPNVVGIIECIGFRVKLFNDGRFYAHFWKTSSNLTGYWKEYV